VPKSICLWIDHGNKTRWETCQAIIAWIIIQEGRAERLLFLISIHPSKETRPHKTSYLVILLSTKEADLDRQGTEIWRAGLVHHHQFKHHKTNSRVIILVLYYSGMNNQLVVGNLRVFQSLKRQTELNNTMNSLSLENKFNKKIAQ